MHGDHIRTQLTADQLQAVETDPQRRLLVRGGTVLTMDPAVPDLAVGDVLVRGSVIEAVGPDLGAAATDGAALVIDATGTIVLPGFQDAHRHCWSTQMRRYLTDTDAYEYVAVMHETVAPACRPDDVYAGTLLGALGALDSGVTTLLDFSHNSRTTAHIDAALAAHTDAGIRVVLGYGPPLSGEWDHQWPQDIARLADHAASCAGGLATTRVALMADSEFGGDGVALSPEILAHARALGLGVIVDGCFGVGPSAVVVDLDGRGLLGSDVTLIHCTALTDAAWRAIAASGTRVALCPTSDAQIGLGDGMSPIQRVLDLGVTAGISVDAECSLSTSFFAQMQAILTVQRMESVRRAALAEASAPARLTTREVLELATVGGSRVNAVDAVTGTLSVGNAADIILVDATAVNTAPLNSAVATVVLGAETHNVDTVLVAGRIRKHAGRLVGVDVTRALARAEQSRDHLLTTIGKSPNVLM